MKRVLLLWQVGLIADAKLHFDKIKLFSLIGSPGCQTCEMLRPELATYLQGRMQASKTCQPEVKATSGGHSKRGHGAPFLGVSIKNGGGGGSRMQGPVTS